MDSWTLKGDSYSFLRSAPRTISLRNREGTPNHVEIFDITNIPNPRTAISETTCLCDIFGDDRDSPALSSSPASGAFVPPPREVDRGAAASPLVDDSSGSYHTAHGSSEGEEGFEDPKDTARSPTSPISEGKDSEGHDQITEHSELPAEIPKLESAASPPLPLLSTESASLEVLDAVSSSRTPSPGHNSPQTLKSTEGRASSTSSSLSSHQELSQTHSPQPSNPGYSLSSSESQLTPPLLESSGYPKCSPSPSGSHKGSPSPSGYHKGSPSPSGYHKGSPSPSGSCKGSPSSSRSHQGSPSSSRSHQGSLSSSGSHKDSPSSSGSHQGSPSSSRSHQGSLSSSGSHKGSPSSSGSRRVSPSSSGSHNNILSSEQRSQSFNHQGLTPTFEPRVIFSSNSTSRSSVDIYRQTGERSTTPESRDYCYSPDTQDCSPFSELRGRVSVHDLLSRGSTPDIEGSPYTPELIAGTSLAVVHAHENQDSQLSANANSAASTPLPTYTSPSPVSYKAHTPECRKGSVSPAARYTPSPALSLGLPHNSPTSDSLSPALSPVPYSLPSRGVSGDYCPKESYYTAASPEIRVTESSPEVSRRGRSTEENLPLNSADHQSECSRATTSSPHITGLCYSVIQPEEGDSATYPEIAHLSTSEPIWRESGSSEPKCKAPVRQIEPGSGEEDSTVTIVSPDQYYKYSDLDSDNTETIESPQPSYRSLSPETRSYTPSPELRHQDPSPESRPYSPSPEQRHLAPSPDTINHYPFPETRSLFSLPEQREDPPSPEPIHFETHPSLSPESQRFTPSPKDQPYSYSPEPRNSLPSPEKKQLTPSPQPRDPSSSPVKRQLTPSPQPRDHTPSAEKRHLTPSPQPRDHTPSAEKRHLTPSPHLRDHNSSPEKSQHTPSPQPRDHTPSPEKRQPTPSPQPRDHTPSPEKRQPTPSPQPRDPTSSPEKRQLTPSPQPRDRSSSPEKRQLSLSPKPRDPTSSPGIIHYTPSPEPIHSAPSPFDRQSSPMCEPKHNILSPEEKMHTPSPGHKQYTSSPVSSCLVPPAERTFRNLSPERRYSSLSPASRNQMSSTDSTHLTPSPNPRRSGSVPDVSYRNLSPDMRHQTPSPRRLVSTPSSLSSMHHSPQLSARQSPECRTGQLSPLAPSPQHRCNPSITGSPFRNVDPFFTQQPYRFPQDRYEVEESSLSDEPNHGQTAVDTKSAPPDSNRGVRPPRERHGGTQEQHEPSEINPKETSLQSVQSNTFNLLEDQNHNAPVERQSSFHSLPVSTVDRQQDILLDLQAVAISPVQQRKEPRSKFPINSKRFDKIENKNAQTTCKPEYTRKKPTTKVVILSREEPAEDTDHHVSKRRTPSPPITRFTPVHIIAPEKPYRLWQNRRRSPPQLAASTPTDNFKNQMTNWVSPGVMRRNSKSQDDWPGQEGQIKMVRGVPLEAESRRDTDTGREQPNCTRRGMESDGKREEQLQEKREGRQGHASYRGQQVELSFSARNRKGPESHSTASTGKQTSKGTLTAHSYSERLPATRQPQQQQRRGGPTRRQPPVPPNMSVAPGRVSKNRPRQSSSSSMGSELDEADSEVKWFSDGAFRSLSSPEIDYLDMYNSSHRSSTNVSQPSTQESPAGASSSLLAYADFKGSGQRLDNEDFPLQPATGYSDGLNPAKRYEMGSFECVDVAVEREEPRKGRRGVPKRQIQLKRKNTLESRQDESSESGSPVVPGMVDGPSFQGSLKETVLRQNSTPVTMHEAYHCEPSIDTPEHTKNTFKLQKSTSLDETHPKTKMATCLIKSVLSKKMQGGDREEPMGEGNLSYHEEKTTSPVQAEETLEKPIKNDTLNLSSSRKSQCSLSSEDLAVGTETNTMASDVRQLFETKSSKKSSPTVSQHGYTELPDKEQNNHPKTLERPGIRSELMVPFRRQAGGCKREEERASGKSAKNTIGNKAVNFETESHSLMEARQEQQCRSLGSEEPIKPGKSFSKTSDIKDGLPSDKKKSSLNVSLTPELEINPDLRCELPSPETSRKSFFKENEDKEESKIDVKTEEEEGNVNNKVKAPMHKVRDVRRLVKNTYNLSFKASSATIPSPTMAEHVEHKEIQQDKREEITEERRFQSQNSTFEAGRDDRAEEPKMEGREAKHPTSKVISLEQRARPLFHSQPMQIECKAVCWKEDKDKISPGESKHEDKWQASAQLTVAEASQPDGYLYGGPESHMTDQTKTSRESDANKGLKEDSVEAKPETVRRYKKPPLLGSLPKLPSKEREVSTAVVVIRDGFSKHKSTQDERPMPSIASNSESSSHAVSMLLKEKGYQAEIGAVLNEGEPNTIEGKGMPHKHVNRLEIPLQVCSTSETGVSESRRERTFSTSSAKSTPTTEAPTQRAEGESVDIKQQKQQKIETPLRNTGRPTLAPPVKPLELKDFDSLKRQDPTFPPRSPALRYKPQQIEVKSLSKETPKQETSTNKLMLNKKPQSIEVKSISNNQTKPAVPPKPNYKFKPPDSGPLPNESQAAAEKTLNTKPQEREERSQTIVVSSPTIYRKLSSEGTSASNYTRKLAVSAVSSCRPPQNKTTTVSSQSNSSASSNKEQSNNTALHPQPSPQSSGYAHSAPALGPASVSAMHPAITSEPCLTPGTNASQISGSSSTVASGPAEPAVVDLNRRPQYSRTALAHDQAKTVTSNNAKQCPTVSTTQTPQYAHEQRPFHRSLSSERPQRADDLRFYASDDPPSYDERESFSPLMLQGSTTKAPNRYFAAPRPPPCSCTSHAGLNPPHRHHSPHNHTPPASAHSPGHPHPYPIVQPPMRPHQCRVEPPPMSYQPSSPKSSPLGPAQPPSMYHPLNQPPSYPPHPSLMHPCAQERPLQLHHMEARRPSLHRPPQQQQQQPGMSSYGDHGQGHSPGLPHLDPQYPQCGPQGMGSSYGSEYEGDSASVYSEGGFGQTPRRMLMDPETGKYFYIEVPVQPLRKMLFDPETGQYVEVLIPQQSMSHSGLYPPTAAPYPSMHNPNMYAAAPQYMQPYAAPPPLPPPPHSQTQPPPPARHPDGTAAATALHQNGAAGAVYGGPSGQEPKMDPQSHPPLDQSYLEGMYYVPTGMNASANPPPVDCYHKHSPSHHAGAGGKRS